MRGNMSDGDDRGSDAPKRARMVGWYDPPQLARTGFKTVVSALFGERADFRAVQALSSTSVFHDMSKGDDAWVDYVADTGDGFASTYAVASALGLDSLEVSVEEGGARVSRTLPRGRALVMGGDEVYPTPTASAYETRLVGPYASALPFREGDNDEERPSLFAVPGNHDWYDGLGAFMGLFCAGRRIGNWRTPQERSYFVIALPQRAWLVGVDVQLSHDIDRAQLDAIMKALRDHGAGSGHRVILCTAEPDWSYRASDACECVPSHLDALREEIERTGASIVLQLAGDLHHYRRQSDADGARHLVTAGGGGAFLHPTHTNPPARYEDTLGRAYACVEETEYPSRAVSRRLSRKNLVFPWINRQFGVTTALVYVILGLVMPPASAPDGPLWQWPLRLGLDGLANVSDRPASAAWVLMVFGGFLAFTDTHVRWYRWVAGTAHGAMHLALALAGGIVAVGAKHAVYTADASNYFHAAGGLLLSLGKALSLLAYVGALALWGYVMGAALFGLYLWVSVRLFGRHSNEAFSALQHDGHKNCLRMHVTERSIEVFALGFDEVAPARSYMWKGNRWVLNGKPVAPRVIDRFTARVTK